MINTSDISIILKNMLSIPLIIFIGVVYFRKTELLINDYEHTVAETLFAYFITHMHYNFHYYFMKRGGK